MSERAHGYYELELFKGSLRLPLKLCISYPSEDKLRATPNTKIGIDKRPLNRIYVLGKLGTNGVHDVEDIERVVPWNSWQTYLNTGTSCKPVLEEMSEDLQLLMEKDKIKNKSKTIHSYSIHKLNTLKPYQFTGRHFHTYPHTQKDKTSKKNHTIYQVLYEFLMQNDSYLKITYFSKGEETGALYPDNGVLRISGIHATNDINNPMMYVSVNVGDKVISSSFAKFEKLVSSTEAYFELEWRDYMRRALEENNSGVSSPSSLSTHSDDSIADIFDSLE